MRGFGWPNHIRSPSKRSISTGQCVQLRSPTRSPSRMAEIQISASRIYSVSLRFVFQKLNFWWKNPDKIFGHLAVNPRLAELTISASRPMSVSSRSGVGQPGGWPNDAQKFRKFWTEFFCNWTSWVLTSHLTFEINIIEYTCLVWKLLSKNFLV